ncbi:DNA primase [Alcanivorax hongdengensis A-11-3]|uniref:DNA primase n=1 Tax=Alcanivorax hongdengensis A-11-3 TaxID=1177179 RepID=L0WEN8_9GAMM|nr:DNA primase [Alcanivorax hongdengensis]EKF74622.1 DNA primase [Alcanivorax hongdengensis A-11-3]
MARIPENFIQDLLARTDLVELIDARVPLKKTGRNYSACCPFHQEKTPSFTVAPDKQFYYCFGCGASGNAVGFLMEYEHLNFPEAVKQLASRAGMEVPESRPETAADRQKKDRLQSLYDLLSRAETFYAQQLRQAPERQKAVSYLKNRGLSGEIAKRFALGFAPPGFDNLITGLSLTDAGLEQALTAGLLVRREDTGRTYDKFRDRIIFPIRDTRGRTIGFGGRVLGDGKPKYLNSPETPVFHKGQELYGLWEWRQSRDRSDRLYVVEGYMDVIALAQHGVPNVVATLGTATTEDHARKLFRQVNEVILCFDGDQAGVRAAWRALESLLPALDDGKQVRFLFLPDGEDPDTLVRNQGPEALRALTDKADALSTYLFRHLAEGLDLETVDGRARLARLALPYLDKPAGPVYRALLAEELSRLTRLDKESLAQLKPAKPAPASPPAASTPQAPPPWDEPPPDDMLPVDSYDEPDMGLPTPARGRPRTGNRRGPQSLAERLILVLLDYPDLLEQHPLPEGLEQLDLPHLDLLIQVADQCRQNHSPAALLGAIMALEQGETLPRLLKASLKPPMAANTAKRLWQDALSQLEVARLEAALLDVEQAGIPDPSHWQALHKALAEARQHARKPFE